MKKKVLIRILPGLILAVLFAYLAACDSRTGITDPPPPPPPPTPNPYGEGNGKITFFRTQQIDGPITIKISDKTLNDSIVWTVTPNCDTNIAASVILKKGNYTAQIEGSIFLCRYDINVEERKCKLIDYTTCNGGYVGCYNIDGLWLRTADGPCPNCMGLKVFFENGIGEVVYTPPGCRFPIGDIKWKDFNINNCTMLDRARDQYGGSPAYQKATLNFSHKNAFIINSESGQIPYSRIGTSYDKKSIKKNINTGNTPAKRDSSPLRSGN